MTLPRILEPEVMDSEEDARDYDAMDHREVNRVFVAELLAVHEPVGDVLDLGTGTALIPIELCRQFTECRVMATDLSINMLELARYNIEAASLTNRLQLAHIDAKQLPFEDETFGTVMSKSMLHHIPEPLQVLREAVRVTAPGGTLFFRDLVRPKEDAEVERLVALYAAEANPHQRQLMDDSLRAALTLVEMQALVAQLGFPPDTVRQTSDRHWTWFAHKPS